jgi:hypothetical protein
MSAPKKTMVYHKGLINGASKEYKKKKDNNIDNEIHGLMMAGLLGVILIVGAIVLMRFLM